MRGFNNELFYAQIFSGADSAVPAFLDTPLGGLGLTPAVGQSATGDQQARMGQHIADDDPLDRCDLERKCRGDRRKADVDGAVERA